MAVKYTDIQNIDNNRKREIIERTLFIKIRFSNLIKGKYSYGTSYVISTLYYQYRKFYSDDLTEAEKILFDVYSVFSDENKFNELVNQYNKDFKKIASLYNVTEIYAKIRYYIGVEIKNFEKSIVVLKKEEK